MTPFGEILRRAVEATPGAIGGALADAQGEMVDAYATQDADDWAILTATYGVVLAQLTSAFGTWHFGGPEYFIAQHAAVDVVVHVVDAHYYALLAIAEPNAREANAPEAHARCLGHALATLRATAAALHEEMW